MAAPPKPWDKFGRVNAHQSFPSSFNSPRYAETQLLQDQLIGGSINLLNHPSTIPPPLPPRSNAPVGYQQYNNSFSPFSSYMPPMSMNMYGNSFGSYGYRSYGLNSYNDHGHNGFLQMAEESSRQAFQPLESTVQAVGSVYMMLESMYQATHNSFRAVVGVADQFTRMKMQVTHILSMLAVFKSLRWFFLRIAYKLGLQSQNPFSEKIWQAANQETSSPYLNENDIKQNKVSWPIYLFVGLIFGMPWLIWKILSSISALTESKDWATGLGDHYVGVAEHDFNAENDQEVSFRTGEEIRLAPKELQPKLRGWLLGSTNGIKTGLVPANYVKIMGERKGSSTETHC